MVPQIMGSLVFNHTITIFNISVFIMLWYGKMIQRSKKSPFNEIDVQMASMHLFLIILIVFIMICIMKDAQWHLAQNLSFCYVVTKKN